jgi:hypothetical protein
MKHRCVALRSSALLLLGFVHVLQGRNNSNSAPYQLEFSVEKTPIIEYKTRLVV